MTGRGLTLLELLLALSLLSGLAMAAVAWTTTSVASSRRLSMQARWEAAADATLRLIERDLSTGDAMPDSARRRSGQGLLQVEPGAIRIPVRCEPYSGEERATYTYDEARGVLTRSTGVDDKVVLLGDLAGVGFELIEQGGRNRPSMLRIRLTATSGSGLDRLVTPFLGADP